MSPLSYELELLALAVAFYLYDSSVLLFSNEVVLTCDSARRWSAITGQGGIQLAGRTLCVLNPFTPYRAAFRLCWNYDQMDPDKQDSSWSGRALNLRPLTATTLCTGLALFVLLPIGMLSPLGAYGVIPAVSLMYGSILLALWQQRSILARNDRRRYLGSAFECIACPPFAVNLIRRSTLAERIAEPAPIAAARLLDSGRWREVRDYYAMRLEEAMRMAEENSDERRILESQRQHLNALDPRP